MEQTNTSKNERGPNAAFVAVPVGVLFGAPWVSDGALVTYLAVSSHDWWEPARGGRKGYVFPSLRRLAELRRTTIRTIQRHLGELIRAGLVARDVRAGRPSLLYVRASAAQTDHTPMMTAKPTPDKSVVLPATKMSSPNKKQEEGKKNKKYVNGDLESVSRRGFETVGALLSRARPNGVTGDPGKARREYHAHEILGAVGDTGSLGCYRRIAQECPADVIFEALSLVRDTARSGTVRSRGALFVTLVKRLCRARSIPLALGAARGAAL